MITLYDRVQLILEAREYLAALEPREQGSARSDLIVRLLGALEEWEATPQPAPLPPPKFYCNACLDTGTGESEYDYCRACH